MIYIVYWLNDYKRALDSLCKHAVCGGIRYVPLNKAYLLPDVMKRFDLGLQRSTLLAVCVSDIIYTDYSWRATFGPDMEIETVMFTEPCEREFMEWFNYHISPFSRTVRGGVVRHVVRPDTERKARINELHDRMMVDDFVADMKATFQADADDVLRMCLKEVGTQYGEVLCNLQDEWLIMNKKMMVRWARLDYHRRKGDLTNRGYHAYDVIMTRVSEFIDSYIKQFYESEKEWDNRFCRLWYEKKKEYCVNNEIEEAWFVPSEPVQLSTFRKWLEIEFPKQKEGYFVLPIWYHEELVKSTMLARVMPWEVHLRNLATFSPKPPPKVVLPPSSH